MILLAKSSSGGQCQEWRQPSFIRTLSVQPIENLVQVYGICGGDVLQVGVIQADVLACLKPIARTPSEIVLLTPALPRYNSRNLPFAATLTPVSEFVRFSGITLFCKISLS
jgi:hypothetical protein